MWRRSYCGNKCLDVIRFRYNRLRRGIRHMISKICQIFTCTYSCLLLNRHWHLLRRVMLLLMVLVFRLAVGHILSYLVARHSVIGWLLIGLRISSEPKFPPLTQPLLAPLCPSSSLTHSQLEKT